MDQARWMVILSVFLSMAVALTVLHRLSSVAKPVQIAAEVEVAARPVVAPAKDLGPKTDPLRRTRRYGKINFPKPPAHTFAVEKSTEFDQSELLLRTDGKILE